MMIATCQDFSSTFEEPHASTSGLNASTHHVTGFDPSLFGGRQKFGLGQHFIKEIGLAVRIRKTTVCRNVLNGRVHVDEKDIG